MSVKAKKRIVNLTAYLLIAFLGIGIFVKPLVYAEDNNETQMEWCKSILGGINTTICETMGVGPGATHPNLYDSCITADEQFTTVKTLFKLCGGFLVLIIALSHLFTRLERGGDYVESVFKTLIEILIAGLFIMNLDLLVSYICDFGNWVVDKLATLTPDDETMLESRCIALLKLVSDSETGGFTWGIITCMKLIVPYLASVLISMAAKFCLYQAALEIGVRKMFLPLAIADIYQDGLRSPGVRYLKKLLACFLKIAVCCAVGKVVGTALGSSLAAIDSGAVKPFEFMFGNIAISASAVGFMFKGGEVANDVVGA